MENSTYQIRRAITLLVRQIIATRKGFDMKVTGIFASALVFGILLGIFLASDPPEAGALSFPELSSIER